MPWPVSGDGPTNPHGMLRVRATGGSLPLAAIRARSHVKFKAVVFAPLDPLPGDCPHRRVVGAERHRGHDHRQAPPLAEVGKRLTEQRVRRHPSPHGHRAAAGPLHRTFNLGHDRIDSGLLKRGGQIGPRGPQEGAFLPLSQAGGRDTAAPSSDR